MVRMPALYTVYVRVIIIRATQIMYIRVRASALRYLCMSLLPVAAYMCMRRHLRIPEASYNFIYASSDSNPSCITSCLAMIIQGLPFIAWDQGAALCYILYLHEIVIIFSSYEWLRVTTATGVDVYSVRL